MVSDVHASQLDPQSSTYRVGSVGVTVENFVDVVRPGPRGEREAPGGGAESVDSVLSVWSDPDGPGAAVGVEVRERRITDQQRGVVVVGVPNRASQADQVAGAGEVTDSEALTGVNPVVTFSVQLTLVVRRDTVEFRDKGENREQPGVPNGNAFGEGDIILDCSEVAETGHKFFADWGEDVIKGNKVTHVDA
jgi:hypothetical protein